MAWTVIPKNSSSWSSSSRDDSTWRDDITEQSIVNSRLCRVNDMVVLTNQASVLLTTSWLQH